MTINLNATPYYNDWDEQKKFVKLVFRPGYAVQARELTQIQDIAQNQVGRLGSFIFKSGSQVKGGEITLDTDVTYANIQTTFAGVSVDITQFANTIITDTATNTVRASVLAVSPKITGSSEPHVMMLKYLTGVTFTESSNVRVEGANIFATLANTNSQGIGSVASIREGIYFLDLNNLNPIANANANTVSTTTNAYFVRVDPQTVILDKFSNTPTYRVGLEVSDVIITEEDDTSLFDPAIESTNYQAPGAVRYVINTVLSKRSLESQDDTSFIELLRVVDGQLNKIQKYPVLSDLNDTLARRTYDQSGDFTVTPFSINLLESSNNDTTNANSQLYHVSLDAGKAYVKGYEHETVAKTYLTAPKARTYINVAEYEVQTYYGNYLLIDNVKGEFNIGTLPSVDIHCVSSDSVNTRTIQAYSNTLIGTARMRALEYSSASNTSNGLTHVFRSHLFDVNTSSITSVSSNSTPTSITFGPLFSSTDNAYVGMVVNIPFTGDNRTITNYAGSTRIATVDSSWSVQPAIGNTFTLLCSIASAESIGINGNSTFASANSNINTGSKNLVAPYFPVSLTDISYQPLIFRLPNSTIAAGLQNPTYQYRYRVTTGQTLQPGVPLVVNLSIPGDATATFSASGISGSDLVSLSNFILVTNPGGGVAGSIVPMTTALGRSISATDTVATFTMNAVDSTFNNVDIFASITSNLAKKTKTKVTGNTNNVLVSGGTVTGNSVVYLTSGQVYFSNPKNTNLTTPNQTQSLYISDCLEIVAIVDSGNVAIAVTDSMLNAAINNTTMPGSSRNMTSSYNFYNGQKDTYYDHATISLKPGQQAPLGQVLVVVNYYSHSSTGGYFSVDSYPNYSDIPIYQTNTNTGSYTLRDCIDFRPRRDDAVVATTFSGSTILIPEPLPSEGFTIDYAYYLPRIDRVILTKNGDFRVIEGVSGLIPSAPKIPESSMLLYTLTIPPYTFYSANIIPQMYDNKRYTMRDIGTLEKRIQTLEYYTTLNALEKSAVSQKIQDSLGLDRPKNGILVDNFQGSSIADVLNPDYFAAIDSISQELRPPFDTRDVPLTLSTGLSSNYNQKGKILTLPYTLETLIDQPTASRTVNLNPFNLTVWNGSLKLNPESDSWFATEKLPDVITNLSGDNDAWAAIGRTVNDSRNPFNTVWNNWQTVWTGLEAVDSTQFTTTHTGDRIPGVYLDQWHVNAGIPAVEILESTVQRTTAMTVENQVRTGIQTTFSTDTLTKQIGTNVVNVSIVPFMRSIKINFVASSMKPLTNVYPYFNNVNVLNYVQKPSVITFTSNVSFQDTFGEEETIIDNDGGTNSGLGANSATIIKCVANKVYVTDVKGVIYPGKTFIGSVSGNTHIVSAFDHFGGEAGEVIGERYLTSPYDANTYLTANTTGIHLHGSAANTDNYYTGNTIYLNYANFYNTGANVSLKGTITSYNGAMRFATVSPNWNLSVNNEPVSYSIGNHITDENGSLFGSFFVPSNSNVKFPTGTSVFRLLDNVNGDLSSAKTKAEDSFVSQGTLNSVQDQYVSTRVPVLRTQTVTQEQTVVGNPVTIDQIVESNVIDYTDPVAQTFLIDNNKHPYGVFITGVKVCFATKDNFIPVTLQLRPTVNGFPSSGTIIPFSEVVKTPKDIIATQNPDLSNSASYTEFLFDAPIHLLPGTEYSLVLISNSNNYEIYTAAVGDKYLGSDRLISQPPYMGVLFKSQNSSTWTPFQGESLMFNLSKAVFNTNTSMSIVMNSPRNLSNIGLPGMSNNELYMDTMYVNTSDKILKDTTLSYSYRSTGNTSRTLDASYTNFIPRINYNFSERKVLEPTGNSFYLKVVGTSLNRDISPILDIERTNLLTIRNIIDNGQLANSDITVTNSGQGYNIANTNAITISGGGGSGASAVIGSVDANGNVTSVVLTYGGEGSGYTRTPNTSVTTSGYSPTAQSFFVISGETDSSGGNYTVKYITKKVTLKEGMDAGDLNVTFDAHKPIGTQIYVYYKVQSAEDNDLFDNKSYTLMSLYGTDSNATSQNDFKEYTYVPELDQYGNPIRRITYDSYDTFKYFAIKIVMASSNPINIPRIKRLRIYALPESE